MGIVGREGKSVEEWGGSSRAQLRINDRHHGCLIVFLVRIYAVVVDGLVELKVNITDFTLIF
jgi:hypothetical protein